MPTTQAIAGVSAGVENQMMTVYPSIAATAPGRWIGMLCDSIPLKIGGIKLSYLLFAPPMLPLALGLYFYLKLFGDRYVLTNRSVQTWKAFGSRRVAQVPMTAIEEVEIERLDGQAFYHAADLVLLAADGSEQLRLCGIPRADVFRQIILEARNARLQTEAALTAIQARQPA